MDQDVETRLRNLRSAPRCGALTRAGNSMPTPCPAGPQAVSFARRAEPRRASRYEKRKFSQWKLDGRSYRGAKVAAFSSAVVCNNGISE